MPVVIKARVKETTTTTGTGAVSLLGASTGFRTFLSAVGNGNQTYYTIEDGTNWECGVGTVNSGTPPTLTRNTILASSNGGSAVNWGAGTRNVFCDIPESGLALTANNLSDMASASTCRTNLGLGTSATMAASRFGLIDSGMSGGTNGKVVRISGSNTWTNASQADTAAQLYCLGFKTSEGIYLAGSYVPGLSSLTADTTYYLSTGGDLTSTAPTPSSSVRLVAIGKAISSTSLYFNPALPIGG